jgi:hypothetical protein
VLKQSHCNRGESHTAGQHTSFSCFVIYGYIFCSTLHSFLGFLFICNAKLNVTALNSALPCKKSFNHSDHCLLGWWHVVWTVGTRAPEEVPLLYPYSSSTQKVEVAHSSETLVPICHSTFNRETASFSKALVPLY